MSTSIKKNLRPILGKKITGFYKSCLCLVILLAHCLAGAKAQVTTISNGASVTVAVSATATTPGDMIIGTGGALTNNGSLSLAGNWANNGSFTDVSGTVIFNATAAGRTISGLLTGTNKFYNLIFNGAGGAWSFSNNAEAGSNFSLTNGTVTAPAVLTLDGNLTATGGSFINNSGLVVFKGNIAQFYSAVNPLSFYNLTNNNTSGLPGLSMNSDLIVEKELKLITLSKLNLASGNLTLRSLGSQTANIAAIPNEANIITYGSGRFIVERYIPAGVTHGKSWQLLAAPTTGQTVNQSWMEGATFPNDNPNLFHGTQVSGTTGTAGGFDATATVPAMKYYAPLSNSWIEVGNPTTTQIHNTQGYFLFVRGDRTVVNFSGANSAPLPTTLRTKGNILIGAVSSPFVTANLFQSVANPYASAIDFSTITRTGGVDPNFYLFDPTLYGSYGFGGYQTITASTGYLATPGNLATSSTIYNTTDNYNNIQSGAAFFVHATGTGGMLAFDEANKVGGSTLANRFGGIATGSSMLSTNLLYLSNGQTKLADGNRAVFNNNYRNRVDADDAVKILNSSENFGLLRSGTVLAVEARRPIQNNDTLFYNMSGLHEGAYQLMFVPKNMTPGLSGLLIDKFANTRTSVSLDDTAYVNVSVTPDPASAAADRFLLIFRFSKETLPVAKIKIAATPNSDNETIINWQVTNGGDIGSFVIERSADGKSFYPIGNANTAKTYLFTLKDPAPLQGDNFYRVKGIDNKSGICYSDVAKTGISNENNEFNVSPNPVQGRKIQIQFNCTEPGIFMMELIDKNGQVVYKTNINVIAGKSSKMVVLSNVVAAGVYELKLSGKKGKAITQQVVVQ